MIKYINLEILIAGLGRKLMSETHDVSVSDIIIRTDNLRLKKSERS